MLLQLDLVDIEPKNIVLKMCVAVCERKIFEHVHVHVFITFQLKVTAWTRVSEYERSFTHI